MWTQYFKFIKLRRGRVIVPVHGEIDFSRDDIPLEVCKELYDKGFTYLELTELGKTELFGITENFQVQLKNRNQGKERIIRNQLDKKK